MDLSRRRGANTLETVFPSTAGPGGPVLNSLTPPLLTEERRHPLPYPEPPDAILQNDRRLGLAPLRPHPSDPHAYARNTAISRTFAPECRCNARPFNIHDYSRISPPRRTLPAGDLMREGQLPRLHISEFKRLLIPNSSGRLPALTRAFSIAGKRAPKSTYPVRPASRHSHPADNTCRQDSSRIPFGTRRSRRSLTLYSNRIEHRLESTAREIGPSLPIVRSLPLRAHSCAQ